VLFADLKGSMALLAERDPEEARQLLAPVLERSRLACFAPSVGASAARRGVGEASGSAGGTTEWARAVRGKGRLIFLYSPGPLGVRQSSHVPE
jgi:hypothetical protein